MFVCLFVWLLLFFCNNAFLSLLEVCIPNTYSEVFDKFMMTVFDDFFWQIFWQIFWRICLMNILTNLLTNLFDEFFDKFFWRSFWQTLKSIQRRKYNISNIAMLKHITPLLFHLNYSAFLQQKTPFVWARHAWLNRLLSSKTNTFSTKTPRMNGRLLCVPCKKRDPVWMGRG